MRVLITGGCGFIGSHLVRKCIQLEHIERIVNLDALTYAGQPLNLVDIQEDPKYLFVHGTINDSDLLHDLIEEEGIDCIINLAAESHVDRSIGSVGEFVKTNVDGTRTILEEIVRFAKSGKSIGLIQVSTDEVYGSLEQDEPPFTEDSPLRPMNPYAATKAASDMMVQAFVNTHGISAIITRCSNNYGPNQFPEKLIPLMVLNSIEGKALPVYGDGMQIRDWIHVEDHVDGIILSMGGLNSGIIKSGEVINFGADHEMPNIEIVKTVVSIVGANNDQIKFVSDRPGHDRRYAMGYEKAERVLSWEPKIDWQRGIRETVEWYISNSEWVESIRSDEYRSWLTHHYGGGANE